VSSGRRVFAYENLRIGVRSAEGVYLEWLEEFFVPQFGVEEVAVADWEITIVLDGDRYERLVRLGPSREELLCFALDTRDIHLPRWNADSPAKILFDEKAETFFLVESECRRITLVSRRDGGRSRIAVMRVVRELAMNRAQRDGGVILHASAFNLGNGGVIVTGPKGAGKTTLLMYALQATPSEYVSNDRVLLRLEGAARIRGIPTIVTLREPTLRFFPPVLDRLRESGYTIRLTRREASELSPTEPTVKPDGRRSLGPNQFCDVLEVKSTAGARPAALVFPRLCDRTGPLRLSRMPKDRAAERLYDSLFGVRKLRTTSPLFSDAPEQPAFDQEKLEGACRALTSEVGCYECELGPDAYSDNRSSQVLVDQLGGAS
jgi:energy-coupling factor transporter ATP-binding protein EcfA2